MAGVGGAGVERVAGWVRPAADRLDLVAAGAIPLSVAVAMINVRFDGVWGRGVLLVVTLLAALAVFGPAMAATKEGIEHPRPAHTALLVAGLGLVAVTIFRLAQVFGVDQPLSASGTVFWMSLLLAGVAAVPAWGWLNSPVCALIEVVAGGVALLAFVDWVFDPSGITTFRWILLLFAFICAGAHLFSRPERPRHAVQMVNAAAISVLALELTFAVQPLLRLVLGRGGRPDSTWWELVILVAGLVLVAYATIERQAGPGYLGFLVLAAFAAMFGIRSSDGASLIGWPLLLLLVGGGALGLGLRPRRPPPPTPAPPEAETRPLPPS